MEKTWLALWITAKEFESLEPKNVFHKELEKKETVEHHEELKNYHMLVRKQFKLKTHFQKAIIDISGDDYYKLYVNGQFVGQGPAPAYYFHYNYNSYDISEFLRQGENIIAVHVYYQGLINRVWNSGDFRQGLISELYIDNKLELYTDSSWKYTRAKEYTGEASIGYTTQYLENIDSRLTERNWRCLEYDDSRWNNVSIKEWDDYKLVRQITPSLQVSEKKPESYKKLDSGHYFIDFGSEITGQFKMKAKGHPGQAVTILHGEELEEGTDSKVRYNLRCNASYKENWTLSDKDDSLEFYDYKAFRYVEVIGPEEAINPESFSVVVRHYPIDENASSFKSSSLLLNSIWDLCKNTLKIGVQEGFLDCPQREKGQYLGDATVTAHSHMYISGDLRMYKKVLKDFSLSSFICPGLMAVAPGSFMQEIADFSLQWPLQLLTYYRHSGDKEFLKEMYPTAEGIIKYFKKYERNDGLLENVSEKWNLVDWPQNLRDEYDFHLSIPAAEGCHNVINAFYCGAVKTLNEIRYELGIPCEDVFPKLKDAFIEAFYRKDFKLFADSTVSSHCALHSNIIALFYGLYPEEAVPSIVSLIRGKGLNCGVYNSYFLLKGLARVGEYDLIYDLITSEDEHSWSNMLKEGATTCFEAWGKEQKWNTSLCHPWATSPVSVLIEDIIGLSPAKPGWREIGFKPHMPEAIKSLTLEITTVAGRIKVDYQDGKAQLELQHCWLEI